MRIEFVWGTIMFLIGVDFGAVCVATSKIVEEFIDENIRRNSNSKKLPVGEQDRNVV